MHDNRATTESYCTFRVDELLFGIKVQEVQEVIRTQPTTRVPLANPIVDGLMNLRGQIVTALDLRLRLRLPASQEDDRSMNVVVRSSEGPISLLVDKIGDVIQVDRDTFEPPPETLQGDQKELIRGAYKLDEGLLLILDTERVLRVAA